MTTDNQNVNTAAAAATAPKKSAPKKATASKKVAPKKAAPKVEAFVGTVAELTQTETGITINGVPVSQPDLSVLTRLKMIAPVGVSERPAGQRGPAAKIYELTNKVSFAVARR